MLWAYFDESGEHHKETGHLTQLTVGGWIPTSETWKAFEGEWKLALERAEPRARTARGSLASFCAEKPPKVDCNVMGQEPTFA